MEEDLREQIKQELKQEMKQKKKKINFKIIIILLAIIVVAVVGIISFKNKITRTSKQMTESEMLKVAESRTVTYFKDLKDNSVLAETQKGKIFKVSGKIYNITKDHIEITASDTMLKMYLPKEELINLKKDKEITIVGKLYNIKEKYILGEKVMFFEFNNCYIIVNAEN